MDNLTERQKLILALVIRDYIETAQPVGSLRVVENFSLEISSATVRNEMVALTELGYLRQPHTSAGRVPTEEGYRYFVRQLMGHTDLPIHDQTHDCAPVLPGRVRCRTLDAIGCFRIGSPGSGCFSGHCPTSRESILQTPGVNQYPWPASSNGNGTIRW